MWKPLARVGFAACVILTTIDFATAQDVQPSAIQVQSTPQVSAPSSAPCKFLGCLLAAPARQQPPLQVPAPDAQVAAEPTGANDDSAAAPKPKSKTVHMVTIAATPDEASHLKVFGKIMSKKKLRLVKAEAAADFSVQAAFEAPVKGERAKLFTEQLHIIAQSSVETIADLKDSAVSFGPNDSESQSAGRKAFAALNIPIKETPLDLDNAMDALSTGDIAAVIVLAPQPALALKALKSSNLHLVSWPEGGNLPVGTSLSKIDASFYPGLIKPGEVVHAMGVDAVLTISAQGERQHECKTFLKLLSQHSSDFSTKGLDLLRADLGQSNPRRVATEDR